MLDVKVAGPRRERFREFEQRYFGVTGKPRICSRCLFDAISYARAQRTLVFIKPEPSQNHSDAGCAIAALAGRRISTSGRAITATAAHPSATSANAITADC